jgi:SHS2 domain-containing protein
MGAFDILEHPADIGFRAFGGSMAELYANSAMAMLSIAGDPTAAEPRAEYAIEVESGDREGLLVDWLNEVLYWYDGKLIAFREFRVAGISDERIEAVGVGEPRDPERHRAHLIVKAVTYHQLRVFERGGQWIAEVYLDI